jgi:hypothetical protein
MVLCGTTTKDENGLELTQRLGSHVATEADLLGRKLSRGTSMARALGSTANCSLGKLRARGTPGVL